MTRGSFSILKAGPSCSFNGIISAFLAPASATIVRNLTIENGRPARPLRSCRKKTEPPDDTLIATTMGRTSIPRIIRPTILPRTSRQRFQSGTPIKNSSRIGLVVSAPWQACTPSPFGAV